MKVVYIIVNKDYPVVKVGVSGDPRRRLKALELASGCEMEIYYNTVGLGNFLEIEQRMHEHFMEFKKLGEWFKIKPEKAKEKLVEIVKAHGMEDPVATDYLKGDSISELSRRYKVTRQAIIQRLKSYGIHNIKPTTDALNYCHSSEYNDNLVPQHKRSGGFNKIANNIYTNKECFKVSIWISGGMVDQYYNTLEEAKDGLALLKK